MTKTSMKRTHRFLIEKFKENGQVVDLSDDLMHYASRVLRLANGSEIQAWNGQGQVFPARIDYLSKKQAQVTSIGTALSLPPTELLRPLYIAQALPEADKMDWVLEKCTEMGAKGFIPIQAERSVVKLNGPRAEKKHQHWQKVIASAAVQSERQIMPELFPVHTAQAGLELIEKWGNKPHSLFCTPDATGHLDDWALSQKQTNSDRPVVIWVGPEGGWSPGEIDLATQWGALKLRMCPRILRTETFGLACLSRLTMGLGIEPI
ncbi:MAG: 16S rRNA (uracil(1498)-N(3))-methyltransferase [Limnobacter sp.]|nr:16S rRNA (uracil(1498)-N(3))-methyltransferase [Limnobacter sp.]